MTQIRLFVLEDGKTDAELILYRAEKLGLKVVHATHASQFDRAEDCDLALLDLCVPDSFGCETVARFREMYPVMPVVVYTSTNQENQCKDEGADYFVQKKQGPKKLALALIKAIENRLETIEKRAESLTKDDLGSEILKELNRCSYELTEVAGALSDIC